MSRGVEHDGKAQIAVAPQVANLTGHVLFEHEIQPLLEKLARLQKVVDDLQQASENPPACATCAEAVPLVESYPESANISANDLDGESGNVPPSRQVMNTSLDFVSNQDIETEAATAANLEREAKVFAQPVHQMQREDTEAHPNAAGWQTRLNAALQGLWRFLVGLIWLAGKKAWLAVAKIWGSIASLWEEYYEA